MERGFYEQETKISNKVDNNTYCDSNGCLFLWLFQNGGYLVVES